MESFRPGTEESYSNTGFTLLAAVIEAASGQPYERFVQDAVFIPAGMKSTGYLLMDRGTLQVTQQCRRGRAWGDPLSRHVWKGGVSWNLLGAGGMLTTLADLQRFYRGDRGWASLPTGHPSALPANDLWRFRSLQDEQRCAWRQQWDDAELDPPSATPEGDDGSCRHPA